MAEGVEIEFPPSSQRYFCHVCACEVSVAHPDLTCRICQNGFVEEVSPEPDLNLDFGLDHRVRFEEPFLAPDVDSDDSDLDIEPSRMLEVSLNDLIRRTIRRTILDYEEREGGLQSQALRQSLEGVASRMVSRDQPAAALHNGLGIHVVPDMSGNLVPGSFRDLFQLASNLGDYAFGGEWDAIITQILNETEVSGPPPLDKEQIDAIPLISVQKDHISKALQCSICMDDFKITEKVKSLPCEHIFHSDCIKPWLKMHATCPICRKQISSPTGQI